MQTYECDEIDLLYERCGNTEKGVQNVADSFGITETSWYLRALKVIKALKASGEWNKQDQLENR